VEINSRVNYPLKNCLIGLEENEEINMECSHEKFCVSWFSIRVASVGASIAVQAWNEHPIPGSRGRIPNRKMMENNQTGRIDPTSMPTPDVAVRLFESHGGQITHFTPFGKDPLESYPQLLEQRLSNFHSYYPEFGPFFYSVVNGDYSLFRQGILCFIDINKQLEAQLLPV
jgi:hypothetical protein